MEAGCGTGGNLQMLSTFGKLEAFELDDEARAIAKGKMPMDIKRGMLPDNIPYQPESFDVVVAFDVIEHVEQDVESLASLGKQLAPGGRLIMTVPAMPWLWSKHDETHHHFRRYTKKALNDTLVRAGMRPIRISYFNTLLFPAIAGLRMVRKVLGIKQTADDAMPSTFINGLLKGIFGLESNWVGRLNVPVGVSLLAVAESAEANVNAKKNERAGVWNWTKLLPAFATAKQSNINQILKFGVVGIIATLVHVLTALYMHDILGLSTLRSNFIAFLIASSPSYFGNWLWTFEQNGTAAHTFPRFLALNGSCFCLSQALVYTTVEVMGFPMWLGMLPVVSIVPAVSYWLSKTKIFRPMKPAN